VAVVGTRTSTRYGNNVAERFARVFAEQGLVVTSGLADGIDTHDHRGAINAVDKSDPCNTIAVLGNGFNTYYPTANRNLQNDIANRGLLVSEYLPNEATKRFHYPQRNRIVAALSTAVLIVEADMHSGTMITKDFAVALGVDVYAVPGEVTNITARGTNHLIKTGECRVATEPNDVMQSFVRRVAASGNFVRSSRASGRANALSRASGRVHEVTATVSFDERKILDILGREDTHIDDIVDKTGMEIRKLSPLLTSMEMKGMLEKLGGNVFAARIRV
jgi:DNA processing protein